MATISESTARQDIDPDRAQLRGLVVFSRDIARVARFYEVVLHLDVIEKHKTYRVLGAGDLELVIHGIPKAVADSLHIETPPQPRADTALKPMFRVTSLEAIRPLILQNGGMLKPLKKAWVIRGDRVLDGSDPEGNVLQFRELTS